MAAYLAHIDATLSGDEYQLEKADAALSRWRKYG